MQRSINFKLAPLRLSRLVQIMCLVGCLFPQVVFGLVNSQGKQLGSSQIGIRFEYEFAELERSLNNTFKDLLFVDDKFEDNNQDNVIAEAYKKGDITVVASEGNEKLRVIVPLSINATYKFDEKIQGKILWWEPAIEVKEHKPLKFNINLIFDISPRITESLELETQTEVSFDWVTYPYVTFYYLFKFRVTNQVKNKLQNSLEEFAKEKIDAKMRELVNFEKLIKKFQQEELGRPFVLDAESNLWGVANRIKGRVGEVSILDDKLVVPMTFRTELDLLWDEAGYEQLKLEYPKITLRKPVPGTIDKNPFSVHAPVRISTHSLQQIIVSRIAREPIHINQGKNTMHVREIYIKPKDNSLVIDSYLDMINRNQTFEIIATIFAKPVYVQETGDIELKNVDYKLDSESFILSIWSAANKEQLKQSIIDNVRLPVTSLATEVKTVTQNALNNLTFASVGKLKVNLRQVVIEDVFMEGDYFVVLMNLEGTAHVSLENLF